MKECHIFNPETEMALASGRVSYTAPVAVRNFAGRLTMLPALYAPEGSVVLSRFAADLSLPYRAVAYRRDVEIVDVREIHGMRVCPWGWNPALKAELSRAGVSQSELPSDVLLDGYRRLAHRATTIRILDRFDNLKDKGLMPRFFTDTENLVGYLAEHYAQGKRVVMKMPWSSSGRGVFFDPDEFSARNAMSRQGGVMVEPMWDNVLDFASEWECIDGEVVFKGLSVFRNGLGGRYKGNLVASQSQIRDMVCAHCSEDALDRNIRMLHDALTAIVAPLYRGPFGVDMLCDSAGFVNPCVEINLRMTMGHVALRLYEIFGLPGGAPYHFYPGVELPFK